MTTAKHPRNRFLTAEETVVNTGGTQLKQAYGTSGAPDVYTAAT